MNPTITTQNIPLNAGDTVNAVSENAAIRDVFHAAPDMFIFGPIPAIERLPKNKLPKNSAIELSTAAPNKIGSHNDPAPVVTHGLHHPAPAAAPPNTT